MVKTELSLTFSIYWSYRSWLLF